MGGRAAGQVVELLTTYGYIYTYIAIAISSILWPTPANEYIMAWMKEALGLMPLIAVYAPMNDFKLASLSDFNAASGCDPACYKMSVGPEG